MQANQRFIDKFATRLEIPPEKVISTLESYVNTSAASMPETGRSTPADGHHKRGDPDATKRGRIVKVLYTWEKIIIINVVK